MTWKLARDTIVAIPAAQTPEFKGIGLGPKFVYDKNGHENTVGTQSRRYWGRVLSGYSVGPTKLIVNRHRFEFELIVEYVDKFGNTDEMDVAIGSDYEQLCKALTRGDNWNRPTSKIVAVNAASSNIAKFNIQQLEGARRLRIALTVEYES